MRKALLMRHFAPNAPYSDGGPSALVALLADLMQIAERCTILAVIDGYAGTVIRPGFQFQSRAVKFLPVIRQSEVADAAEPPVCLYPERLCRRRIPGPGRIVLYCPRARCRGSRRSASSRSAV
ncbi:hypothetical protein RHIZ404_220800 [Rhizobium sp. EC-SD404]|nr:hypothetical protein RHIZ404_220800 [Rhizobium sp. EC-SD404]